MIETTESHVTTSHTTGATEIHSVSGGVASRGLIRISSAYQAVVAWCAARVRAIGSTVTALGWLVIGGAIVGISVGLAWGWHEFLAFGIVAGVLLAMALPFLFGRRAYAVNFGLDRERTVVGRDVSADLAVHNRGHGMMLPGTVEIPVGDGVVEIAVPFLGPGSSFAEKLPIAAAKRGIIDVGPVTTVRGDPLHILRKEHSWEDTHTLFIHPVTVELPATTTGFIRDLEGNPSNQLVSDDLSFHAIREYVPGDSLRHVHWKSSAKADTLMVRQYEETRRSELMVLLAAGSEEFGGSHEFELAVSAAASIALRGFNDGREVCMFMGGQRPKLAKSAVQRVKKVATISPRTVLDELAGVDMEYDVTTVRQVARYSSTLSNAVSIAFIVLGSRATPRQIREVAQEFPAEISVVVIVCDESATPSVRRLTDSTVVTIAVLDDLRALLLRGGHE